MSVKVKKAKPVKAGKVTKAKAVDRKKTKEKKEQKPKPTPIGRIVYNLVIETLEHNTLGEGEFDLPTILTRYLDKSHPRYKLGLHREYYIPEITPIPYYSKGTAQLNNLLGHHAGLVMAAFGEGVLVKKKEFDLPLCREHK